MPENPNVSHASTVAGYPVTPYSFSHARSAGSSAGAAALIFRFQASTPSPVRRSSWPVI
jgi:hypothetical protein